MCFNYLKFSVVLLFLFSSAATQAAEGLICMDTGESCDISVCESPLVGPWQNFGNGVEQRIRKSPSCIGGCHCKSSIEYRCIAGYYGIDGNCTRCPCLNDVNGISRCGTNTVGSILVTSCRMSSAYSFSDGVGIYNFTQDCAYAE